MKKKAYIYNICITESLAVQQKLNNTKNQLYLDKINF